MLKPISEFDTNTRIAASFRGWVAIDPESGAFLMASNGRTKWGDTRYVMILPNEPLDHRPNLFEGYTFEYSNRKRIRAFSDQEAIELANKKLVKLLCNLYTKGAP